MSVASHRLLSLSVARSRMLNEGRPEFQHIELRPILAVEFEEHTSLNVRPDVALTVDGEGMKGMSRSVWAGIRLNGLKPFALFFHEAGPSDGQPECSLRVEAKVADPIAGQPCIGAVVEPGPLAWSC